MARQRSTRLVLVLVLILVLAGCSRSDDAKPGAPAGPDSAASVGPATRVVITAQSDEDLAVPVRGDEPTRGARTGPVTWVLFSSFACEPCAALEPTVGALLREHEGRIRLIWRDAPGRPDGFGARAAKITHAVFLAKRDEAFWRMHDKIFAGRQALMAKPAGEQDRELGALAAAFGATERDLAENADYVTARLETSEAIARKLDVLDEALPVSFIDGERVDGASDPETLGRVVREHLARAAELEAGGTPKRELYRAMVPLYFKKP